MREKSICVSSKITPVLLLRETTNGKNGFYGHRAHEEALGLFVLLEVGISPHVVHHVGDELHSLSEFQCQTMVFFVLDM